MATYARCGACGGTGDTFAGDHWTGQRCRSCNGEGVIKITSTAKKDHTCNLCSQTIPAGTEYVPVDVPPWACGDGDKKFWHLHQHQECRTIWNAVAHDYDYQYPPDADCWQQMVNTYKMQRAKEEPQ